MQDKLTVSIIGLGNIAGGFDEKKTTPTKDMFSHAGAYKKSGKFVLKNIYDVDKKRAKEFQSYWGALGIANSEDDIINSYQDVISICSPDKFHFSTLKNILLNKSCKTVFVEKPLGMNLVEIDEIYQLSQKSNINIMINYQRHFDKSLSAIKQIKNKILSVNSYYIKGLNHIGITMIDTLVMMLGYPKSVYSYAKHYNKEIDDYTYECILFYDKFNVTIKTIDINKKYNYHIFDIDILTDKKRYTITDNGTTMLEYSLTEYLYSEVKVLTSNPIKKKTNFTKSMLKSVMYLYDITCNDKEHHINTIRTSYNNHLLLEKIVKSFKKDKTILLKKRLWKK